MLKKLLCLFLFPALCFSQAEDSITIKKIFDHSLAKGKGYAWLDYLSNKIGSRLSGSEGADKGVQWCLEESKKISDNAFLQEVMVPHWVRGEKEKAYYVVNGKKTEVNICALGGSIATPLSGLTANVVEVKNFDELKSLGTEKIKGKIVFYNRPMDVTRIHCFEAYGGAVNQRGGGALHAAKYGAVGVVVRSMTQEIDKYPHTGAMRYDDSIPRIPACAISTLEANELSFLLKKDANVQFYFKQSCNTLPDKLSHNVIADLKGSEFPDEIILVGGHLDSWDLAQGAHDDGAGIVQSMEVLSLFRELNIKPKRTIRFVGFMNEENGVRGANKYAEVAKEKKDKHIAAIESDAGGFVPRGFFMEGDETKRNKIKSWAKLFEPYNLHSWDHVGSGTDVHPLGEQGAFLLGLSPDPQRYFDVHHSALDVFEMINRRELQLGAASMAALVYMIDKYGL
ncbi:MAG TPA: M20/M25/M40 family metallo-hydrolase [Bacteroidia bacterium]|nr:M20/M25/M40 family metallo-hydrolase [Bacteroidia bacterium]HNU32060.1 M20/M25/M40 family metallo-hydrolase [Bacteroidia bacterium]